MGTRITCIRIATALSVAAVVCLAGCAGPDNAGHSSGSAAEGFTGPWAELFQQTYDQATSAEERAALEDGEISAQEYAYFQDRIVNCLDDLGVTAHFQPDGTLAYSNPDDVSQDKIAKCNADNGIRVLILKDTITRNPQHRDENQLIVECLQHYNLVGPDYTEQDLANGVDIKEIGQTEEFARCVSDPYSLSGK